mmetsp:Transcript_28732/g.83328  ORF Transcript_28732/g.83328 Transcript_28732/m.83328 type:complete len:240 (-) Transcript_28732:739-1458(-)
MSLRSEDGSRRGSTADSFSTVALALDKAFRRRGTRAFRRASARDATEAADRDRSIRSALTYWASRLSSSSTFAAVLAALLPTPSMSMAASSVSSIFGRALPEAPSSLAGGGRIRGASARRIREATRADTVSTPSPVPVLGGPPALLSAVDPDPTPTPSASANAPSSFLTAAATASGNSSPTRAVLTQPSTSAQISASLSTPSRASSHLSRRLLRSATSRSICRLYERSSLARALFWWRR